MKKTGSKSVKMFARWLSAVALSLIILLGTSAGAKAEEAERDR